MSIGSLKQPAGFRIASCVLGMSWVLLSACTPSLDWREARAGSTGLVAMLPCRPSAHARPVVLAGEPRDLNLLSCRAGESTWAISWIENVDPTTSAELMASLKQAARANLEAKESQDSPHSVPGAMTHPQSGRVRVVGRRPDGTALTQDSVVFTRGLVVFQATVLAAGSSPAQADEFFSGLRFAP